MHDIILSIFLFHCIGLVCFLPVVTFRAGRQRERGDDWAVILGDAVIALAYWPVFAAVGTWDLVASLRKR